MWKVKSRDFVGTEHTLLNETVRLVQCHVLLVDYFLSPQDLILVTKNKWEVAVRNQGEKPKHFPINDRVYSAVIRRVIL